MHLLLSMMLVDIQYDTIFMPLREKQQQQTCSAAAAETNQSSKNNQLNGHSQSLVDPFIQTPYINTVLGIGALGKNRPVAEIRATDMREQKHRQGGLRLALSFSVAPPI